MGGIVPAASITSQHADRVRNPITVARAFDPGILWITVTTDGKTSVFPSAWQLRGNFLAKLTFLICRLT
jgi:hypothetical protein